MTNCLFTAVLFAVHCPSSSIYIRWKLTFLFPFASVSMVDPVGGKKRVAGDNGAAKIMVPVCLVKGQVLVMHFLILWASVTTGEDYYTSHL